MLSFLVTAIKVIFLLGFLVFIHEGGHFLVAKLCKIKVNEFAIGFGPTIWKSKNTKTKYALRLIPLGGFVSMEGEEERSEAEGSFSKASIPKRIAIVLAGGAVNIVFGLIVYFCLVSAMGGNISQTIQALEPEYGARKAGILVGDEIVRINGKRIHQKQDITDIMEQYKGENVTVQVKRNGELIEYIVEPKEIIGKDTGIYLGVEGDNLTTEIVALYPSSPAEKQGVQIGDIILKVDGKDVESNPYKVVEYINESENQEIIFTVKRKEEIKEIKLEPEISYTYLLGVEFAKAEDNFANNIYYGFWNTVDFSTSIIENLKMLFTGKVSANQLTGPIGISNMVAKTKGIEDFIYLVALISLSLGVTNLLPFPPLDGGKVVIYLIEAVRRKPMKEENELKIQTLGAAILIGLTIFVTYNDILRIF
ncbi:MAG: RIP metalloprotease RseP [Clostridia bacterium]|nr:RIP metalloprotease RseP [Clostridia bacterium]